MKSKLVYLAVALAVFLFPALSGMAEEGPAPPPARQIPGINVEDAFPQGCVDCHIIRPDIKRDVRISTILEGWSESVEPRFLKIAQDVAPEGVKLAGRHPTVGEMIKEIPAGCLACHGETSKTAPALDRMVHLYHLTGGAENPYMTVFQGECTHCHKINQTTGRWTVPSGPEK
jgi:mono/diheme cytochrome c family protein